MRKSIFFVNPAYHYSFAIRDELRRLGWRADVYVNQLYPPQLLFSDDVIREGEVTGKSGHPLVRTLRRAWFFVRMTLRYKYFLVYGDAEVFTVSRSPRSRIVSWLTRGTRSPELHILKLLGKKILFFPNGCHQEVLKRDFMRHEGGIVCANCIMPDAVCNDTDNQRIFDLVNRYHDFVIANTPMRSTSLPRKVQIKHLALDLDVFSPDCEIPEEFRLPPNGKLRIMHSFVDTGRADAQRNVKGSPFVAAAIERLKREGHAVEYFYVNNVPSREMRYYQLQADIIVEQLLYGWWGSTGIECMGLGKPVVCYISASMKQDFLAAFPEYDGLPIVEANVRNVYEVLLGLVISPDARLRAAESRAVSPSGTSTSKRMPPRSLSSCWRFRRVVGRIASQSCAQAHSFSRPRRNLGFAFCCSPRCRRTRHTQSSTISKR